MKNNSIKLYSPVNIRQLSYSVFKSGSYKDTQLVLKDKIIFVNRLLLSLTFPSMGELMLSVGEWVDHIIMMPDYSSDVLLETMDTFLSKPEEDEEAWMQNTSDNTVSSLYTNDSVTMPNIEEVYVIKEEMKVEVVEDEELHLKDSQPQQIDAQNCKFSDMKFETYELKKKHEESYIDSEGEFMRESVIAQIKHMSNLNNSEEENKRFLCEFENCGITLKNKEGLKQHIKRYHINGSNVKMYPCNYCTGTFKGRRAYFSHKERCIGVPNNYKCSQEGCTFTCLDERGMLSHFKKHHKKEIGGRDFSCEICGQSYLTNDGKIRHMLANPGPHVKPSSKKKIENLPCPTCGKIFKDKSALTGHINAVHDEEGKTRFKCDQCSRGFSCRGKLKFHLLSHSDERKHSCATCGKKFKSKCNLLKHEKIHSGVKPFKCSFCAKAFLNPDKVRRHELIHTGVMDFRCSLCGKAFNQKVNLGVHERKCIGVTESPPELITGALDPPRTDSDIFPPSQL